MKLSAKRRASACSTTFKEDPPCRTRFSLSVITAAAPRPSPARCSGRASNFINEANPNEHNPLGFYEIPELIELDVELFNRLGVDWTDVRGLPDGWAERADLAQLLARLDDSLRRRFTQEDRLWGLKHPHLCRTLPLYERAAKQAGHTPHVVHIFRDPWTAAASQSRKNGLSRAHALLLWMSYATDAERQARHLPRSWLTYHDLLAQPAAQLRRIEADWPRPARAWRR